AVATAWSDDPGLPGVAVAAALRAAAGAMARERGEMQVELVWTGPPSEALGLRSTRAVLNELVARSTERLLLVSYAAYDIDDLVAALSQAAARGVDIDLVLETKADGGLTVDAADAFHALRGGARFYRWPLDQRDAVVAGSARLHAKCAVRDAAEVFVSSANLTGAAINDNMEMGVLVRNGEVARRLHRHFELLIEDGVLVTAPR
ncbi:MAG: DISARM system phospholipase D-like protein DrmC, partial [Actinomycetes bacterium]